jgi:hypothetical protein
MEMNIKIARNEWKRKEIPIIYIDNHFSPEMGF